MQGIEKALASEPEREAPETTDESKTTVLTKYERIEFQDLQESYTARLAALNTRLATLDG